jgi:hypothetical protein
MSSAEKIAVLLVGAAMLTTLVLPDRQSVGVINALWGGFNNSLAVATGQKQR